MRLPPLGTQHPGTNLPGRIVPHVLGVPALQVGDPVPLVIEMKTHDAPFQGLRPPSVHFMVQSTLTTEII